MGIWKKIKHAVPDDVYVNYVERDENGVPDLDLMIEANAQNLSEFWNSAHLSEVSGEAGANAPKMFRRKSGPSGSAG
jgi:hypothetical protein